jgi:hypothetical protein
MSADLETWCVSQNVLNLLTSAAEPAAEPPADFQGDGPAGHDVFVLCEIAPH